MTVHEEIRRYLDPGELEAGATVITVNNRLSRRLHQLWSARMRAQGREVWETPDILPWNAWLRRCWDQLQTAAIDSGPSPAMLLGAEQELTCWEQIIADSDAGRDLLQPAATARRVREARSLANAWRLDPSADASGVGRDVSAFLAWSARFDALCRERDWVDEALLPDLLAARFSTGEAAPPAVYCFAGFDEITPQQQLLLDAIEDGGGQVRFSDPVDAGAAATRIGLRDAGAEIVAAACWARDALQRRPDARIGIVVPDLAARRGAVAAVFEDVLQPAALLPGPRDAPSEAIFNLSAGQPLADCPVVHDALLALELARGELPLTAAGALLRSPFFAGAGEEQSARAMLEVRFRERGDSVVSTEQWIAAASHWCPVLANCLARVGDEVSGWQQRPRRPSDWVERLFGVLRLVGWPGERTLDSDEYQAIGAWRDLMSGLSALDPVQPELTLDAVLSRIRRLSGEAMFQPERAETPIQVLGLLEASGQCFDHLWVTGLHDEAWPPAPDPNPFLPLPHQRRLGVPRSSPERELAVARRTTERLLAAAPEVRISYPLQDGDRDLRPSPLIEALTPVESPECESGPEPFYRDVVYRDGRQPGRLESLVDVRAPPVAGDQSVGGSELFKLQAECPFRAFARLRLRARPLEEPAVGLDAAERGSLLHRVLESLWRELGSQQALLALDQRKQDALIMGHVEAALTAAAGRRPRVFTERFRALERDRLAARLGEWLAIEKARAPFSVEAVEQRATVVAGGISVEVRIDRIDRLDDGGRVIVDYKTGEVGIGQWFGERPEEPQLPLYSLVGDSDLEALLFARLRAGAIGCVGIARGDGVAPGVMPVERAGEARPFGGWSELLAAWRSVLTRLAEDFSAGDAKVDPRNGDRTCGHCGLHALCRVDETRQALIDGEQADPENDSD